MALSVHQRGLCQFCYCNLYDDNAAVQITFQRFGERSYHLRCFLQKYKPQFGMSITDFRGYNELNPVERAYVKSIFEDHWNQIARLCVTKPIYLMNRKELQNELKRRHITTFNSRSTTNYLRHKLHQYFKQQPYWKHQNSLLIFGYTAQIEKKYHLNIPLDLKKIILRYSPSVI